MAVRIRLKRLGRTHRPFYRVVATESRRPRSGESCEIIGTYDPMAGDKPLQVDIDQVHTWIRRGATYTEGVASLLKNFGYEVYPADVLEARAKQKAKRKAKRKARKKQAETSKGTYVAPSRRAVKKHEAKLKAERVAKLRAEEEERAKAKAAAEEAEAAEAAKADEATEEAPAEESAETEAPAEENAES